MSSALERESIILEDNHTTKRVEVCRAPTTDERFVRKTVSWANREFAAREIAVTNTTTAHPNVVTMVSHCVDENGDVQMIYPYASNGDLFDYLTENPGCRRDMSWVACAFKDIAQGVRHLHEHGILHRDLKLENVIITDKGVAQVCDFSFAEWICNPVGMKRSSSYGITKNKATKTLDVDPERALRKNINKLMGTAGCISPETVKTCVATEATDVYGLGVLLYEMVTGRKAFPEHSNSIFYPSWLLQIDGGALERFIQAMVHADPAERLSLAQILDHEWIRNALSEEGGACACDGASCYGHCLSGR